MKNSFINLALPLWVFSEPTEVGKIKSKDYDPISMSAVKAIPEGYTIYDKTIVDKGSLTLQQLIDHMGEAVGVETTLVSAGRFSMYNAYLPGNKHAPRLAQKVEDLWEQISEEKIPEGRTWLHIELGGSVKGEDDMDFMIPPIKYIFKQLVSKEPNYTDPNHPNYISPELRTLIEQHKKDMGYTS